MAKKNGGNKSPKNIDDNGVVTVMEGTDSMGGPVYLFQDAGGYWVEHHKNSGEDFIGDYLPVDVDPVKAFQDRCEQSVWS